MVMPTLSLVLERYVNTFIHSYMHAYNSLVYVYRSISADLNKKMHLNWESEYLFRYKQLLAGAVLDGEVLYIHTYIIYT